MRRDLCDVLGMSCESGESNPVHCPSRTSKLSRIDRRLAACARFPRGYRLQRLVQQFHLPIGALDFYVDLSDLLCDLVGLRPQFSYVQRRHLHQL